MKCKGCGRGLGAGHDEGCVYYGFSQSDDPCGSSTQQLRINAEYGFDMATALIRDLIAHGLSVDAMQNGKRWIITGKLQYEKKMV